MMSCEFYGMGKMGFWGVIDHLNVGWGMMSCEFYGMGKMGGG